MESTDVLEEARAKACCADLYQSELARVILGDTLHPGGLALTNQMAKLLEIQPGNWVADLASARGASAPVSSMLDGVWGAWAAACVAARSTASVASNAESAGKLVSSTLNKPATAR